MKRDYYITQDGELVRHENTIYFQNENTKRSLPVNRIYSIYAYGSLSLSSGATLYLCKKEIPLHFFDYYGWYKGTLYPRETLVSGDMVVKQAAHYLDNDKRMHLVRKLVAGTIKNTLRNVSYYDGKYDLSKYKDRIESNLASLADVKNPGQAMQIEGQVKRAYYSALDEVLPPDYKIEKRTRQPPENRANTLISFGNSLLYTTCLSEIYNTQLNPTVSFLHEPLERRFSLSLDISEIFKPIIVDRVILKLVNKNMLSDDSFEGSLGDMLLSESGRKLFLKEYDDRLGRTIKHRDLDRKVSYKRLIRLELYKLCKHFLGDKEYDPLVMWW